MKNFILIAILSIFSCTKESNSGKLLNFDEINSLVYLEGNERETFMIEKNFKPLDNKENNQSFIRVLNTSNEQESVLEKTEQIDFNIVEKFIYYRTFDGLHYSNLIKELSNKVNYQQEITDSEGITKQVYSNDSLLVVTFADNSIKIPQYFFQIKKRVK